MLQLKIKATELTGLGYRELLDVQRNAEKAAGGVRELVKEHFDARGGESFWGEAAESVEVAGSSQGAVVAIYQRGVALRFFGGVVRPVRGKALAIPTKNNNSKLWPQEYGDRLRLIPRENKPPLLAVVKGRGKNQRLEPKFTLLKKTTHQADKTVLPSMDEMRRAALNAITTAN